MSLRRYPFRAMGSPCEILLYPVDGIDPDRVADAALAEIARLESKYSRYREDSLTSLLNRGAGSAASAEVDAETAALLDYADTAYRESDGLFDITSGVLRQAWDFKSGVLPKPDQVAGLLRRVGWERVEWKRPQLHLPADMEIDFGGYVKEYAVDRCAALCQRAGVRGGMVDLGGDLAVIGPHPDGSPWTIGIRDPEQPREAIATIRVARGAVATSGDYERAMVVDGKRYGHILDPRTGWPIESFASVSVVAERCLVAGSASTIAMLRGVPGGTRWLEASGLPNLRVRRGAAPEGTLARAA